MTRSQRNITPGNGMKQLIPIGSITGDPIGVRRYIVIDPVSQCTAVSETVCLLPDGTEWKPKYQRQP